MVVLCQKLYICTYNQKNFSSDQSPFGDPCRPTNPHTGGARTARASQQVCNELYRWLPAIGVQQHACHIIVQDADTSVRQLIAKAVFVAVVDPLGHPQLVEVLYGRRYRVCKQRQLTLQARWLESILQQKITERLMMLTHRIEISAENVKLYVNKVQLS